jgi:hypothetical protein
MEESISKLTGCFLTIWNDARKQNFGGPIDHASPSHEIIKKTGGYRIGYNGIKCLHDALEILFSDPHLSNHYSQRYLNEEIENIILSLLNSTPQGIVKQVESSVQRWIQNLHSRTEVEWTVAAPIINLILTMDSIEVGKVTFLKNNSAATNTVIKEIREITKSSTSEQEVKEFIASLANERLGSRVLAAVKVKAVDKRMAKELGVELIEHSLNVLRFYGFGVLKHNPLDYKMYMGIDGTIFSGRPLIVTFNPGSHANLTSNTAGALYEYEFNDETIQRMHQLSFESLNSILKKDQKNEFEELLNTSIDFFGAGMNDDDLVDSYIDFVISLESLILKEREPSKGLLAERVSLIIGENRENRIEIFDYVESLYQLRSNIVHRGFKDITKENVKMIAFFAFRTITTLTSHAQKIRRIDDLKDICDRLKFSGPSFGGEDVPNVN